MILVHAVVARSTKSVVEQTTFREYCANRVAKGDGLGLRRPKPHKIIIRYLASNHASHQLGDFQHRIYHSEKNTPLPPSRGEYKSYISARGVLCWKSPYVCDLWPFYGLCSARPYWLQTYDIKIPDKEYRYFRPFLDALCLIGLWTKPITC